MAQEKPETSEEFPVYESQEVPFRLHRCWNRFDCVCVCMCACLCFVSCVWCSRQGLIGTLGGLKIKQGTFENVEVGICFDGAVCVQGQEGIGY